MIFNKIFVAGKATGINMKKSLLCVMFLLMLLMPLNINAFASTFYENKINTAELKTGDKITFGYYPQTLVTDEELISKLDTIDIDMQSYGYQYYQIIDGDDNYEIAPIDMLYGDTSYKGEVYRKVYIGSIRPYSTIWGETKTQSYQSVQDYGVGKNYWFKWEPIIWRVLSNASNEIYLLSESILDAQGYDISQTPKSEDVEYITWEQSTLRNWLNDDFYNSAFTENEKTVILPSLLKNEGDDANPYRYKGGNDTTDNVWIISYSESIESKYGFNADCKVDDPERIAYGTDYSLCQGLDGGLFEDKGLSSWLLRTPGYGFDTAKVCEVNKYGSCLKEDAFTDVVCSGVRPAIKIQNGINLKGAESHYKNTEVIDKSDSNGKESTSSNKSINPYIVISVFVLAIIVLIAILIIVLKKRKSNF